MPTKKTISNFVPPCNCRVLRSSTTVSGLSMMSPDDGSDGLPDSDDEGGERRRKPMSRQATRRNDFVGFRAKSNCEWNQWNGFTLIQNVMKTKCRQMKSDEELIDFHVLNCAWFFILRRAVVFPGRHFVDEVLVECWMKVARNTKGPSLALLVVAWEVLERSLMALLIPSTDSVL